MAAVDLAAGLDVLAQHVDRARSERQVDERVELEHLVRIDSDQQPPTAITLSGSRRLAARASIRCATSRSSAFSRIVQVLKTSRSASSGATASPMPSDSSRPFTRSESWTFIWQPNVWT